MFCAQLPATGEGHQTTLHLPLPMHDNAKSLRSVTLRHFCVSNAISNSVNHSITLERFSHYMRTLRRDVMLPRAFVVVCVRALFDLTALGQRQEQ